MLRNLITNQEYTLSICKNNLLYLPECKMTGKLNFLNKSYLFLSLRAKANFDYE